MSNPQRVRRKQLMREAEGYLDLISALADRFPLRANVRNKLAERALSSLDALERKGSRRSHELYLRGQAFRMMEDYGQAIESLEEAASLDGENIHIWLALGWCQKRSRRLDLAIQALEEALGVDSTEAIIHYNLACYWALAKNPKLALGYLARAFDLDPNYRDLVPDEPDFDPIREDPEFQSLTSAIV